MSDSRLSPLMASLLLAGVAVAWGAIPLFVRNDVPSVGLVGVRMTLGASVLIIVAASLGNLRLPPMHRGRVVASGLLLASHWIAFFASIKLTTVAIALSVLYLGPIAASTLAGPVLGQVVPRRLWYALGIAATGTLIVVQPWDMGDTGKASIEGLAVAALAAALFAALMLVGYPAARDLRGLTMSMGELVVGSVVLAPATVSAIANHPDELVNFVVLGAVFTGLTGYLYWEVYRLIPVASVSTIMYLEPASAVIWAMLFLGESPTTLTWVGIVLVIAGGAIAATMATVEDAKKAPSTL
ncbi:MAG: DMT family transporter [Acidimicrobiia bacterium]